MDCNDLTRLFDYTHWANTRVLEACGTLERAELTRDLGTGAGSVLGTLVHMLGAEWIWLERWSVSGEKLFFGGLPGPFRDITPEEAPTLVTAFAELHARRAAYLAGLSDESLRAQHPYVTLAGEQVSPVLADQMVHVLNHATHHRGQIVGALRAFGHTPPVTDMIHYFLHTS